jgi:hypothetical protein
LLVAAELLVEFESGECPYSEAIAARLRFVPLSPLDHDVLDLPEISIEILKEAL